MSIRILIAEDQPEFKVYPALEELRRKNVKFKYDIFSSAVRALRDMRTQLPEYDLAIIDLGLPWFEDEPVKSSVGGFEIIEKIIRRNSKENLNIPIIINSTTKIEGSNGETEEEFLKFFTQGTNQVIEHVDELSGEWLYKFIQEHVS